MLNTYLYAMADSTQPPTARGQYRKKKIPECVRNAVWNKYMGDVKHAPCYTGCGEIISAALMHVGHIQAESCGGETTIQNLRPICSKCNTSMGRKNMREFIVEWGFTSPLTSEDDNIGGTTEVVSAKSVDTKIIKRKAAGELKVKGEPKVVTKRKPKVEPPNETKTEAKADAETKAKVVTKPKKPASRPTTQHDTQPATKPVTQEPAAQIKSEDVLIQPVGNVTHSLLSGWSQDEMMFAAEQLSGVKNLDVASARAIVSGVSRNIWCREFLKKFTVAQLRATSEFAEFTRGRTKKHDIVAAIAEGVENIHSVKIAKSVPVDKGSDSSSVRPTWCCFM